MSRTLVIGEPGCTAEGDKTKMWRLLETAHACGCNVWKPQWVSNPALMCERRHIGTDHPKRAYYERAYSWLAFPAEWHQEFSERCHAIGMEYAVTVFLPQDVERASRYADYLKISSFEAADRELLARANRQHGPRVILSTGMSRGQFIDLSTFEHDLSPWAILHCVSAYPAELSAMNLRVIRRGHATGLSDHSRNVVTGAVAVGTGAKIIETHFRLDDCSPDNPDYAVAFTPAEFTQYIRNIRDAEIMLGDGVKKVQPCEEWALPYRVTS